MKVDPSEEDLLRGHLEEVLDGLAVAQQCNQPRDMLQVDVAEEESLKDVGIRFASEIRFFDIL